MTSFHHDKPVGWKTHSKDGKLMITINVVVMRMKGDQILSVCLDNTTHLCLHLAEGGSCDRGEGNVRDIIHGETNQTVKGVFHIGLKLTNFFNICSMFIHFFAVEVVKHNFCFGGANL